MEDKNLIKVKTEEAFRILDINNKQKDFNSQLEGIFKIYKFAVQNVNSTPNETERKKDSSKKSYLDILAEALTNNPGTPASNSVLFKHFLDEYGIENFIVLCETRNDSRDLHVANLVRVGEQYYYFDTTLEKSIHESNNSRGSMFFMYCAGLGRDDYEKLYKPIAVLKDLSGKPITGIPANISNESVPKTIVNAIIQRLPNYSPKFNSQKNDGREQDIL